MRKGGERQGRGGRGRKRGRKLHQSKQQQTQTLCTTITTHTNTSKNKHQNKHKHYNNTTEPTTSPLKRATGQHQPPVEAVGQVHCDHGASGGGVEAHVVRGVVEELGTSVTLHVVGIKVPPSQLDINPILLGGGGIKGISVMRQGVWRGEGGEGEEEGGEEKGREEGEGGEGEEGNRWGGGEVE